MSKKTAKKKSRKSNSAPRNLPWHKALETPILQGAIRPLIETIAAKGFKGLPDLHNNFQAAYKCSVSRDIFTHWLKRLGLYDTVAGTQLRTLAGTEPSVPMTVPITDRRHPLHPMNNAFQAAEKFNKTVQRPDITFNQQLSQHPDQPGQLGLGGEPVAENSEGFPQTNAGEEDEVEFVSNGPARAPAFEERVLALAPSGEGPQPTILGGGVYGAPPGTLPIQG